MCNKYTGRTSLDFPSPFAPIDAGDIAAQSLVSPEPFPGYRDHQESGARLGLALDRVSGKLDAKAAEISPGMQPGNVALDNGPTFTIYVDGTAKYRVAFGAVADAEARREMGPYLAVALINGECERVQESLRAHFATKHAIAPARVMVTFSPRLAEHADNPRDLGMWQAA